MIATQDNHIATQEAYDTTDLKLGSLLLAEIPNTKFKIAQTSYSSRKVITIFYNQIYKNEVFKLASEFANRQARADVFLYNRALSQIRDAINGKREL